MKPIQPAKFTISKGEALSVKWDVHVPRAIVWGVLSGVSGVAPLRMLHNGREVPTLLMSLIDGTWFLGCPTFVVAHGDVVELQIQSLSPRAVQGEVEFLHSPEADRWLALQAQITGKPGVSA